MTFFKYACPTCGDSVFSPVDGNKSKCRSCSNIWITEKTNANYDSIFSKFDEYLRAYKQQEFFTLVKRRYEEIKKEYVSNTELTRICTKILDLDPNDFFSRFFLATCKEDYSLAEFLNQCDIDDNYNGIGLMLDYLIRGLQPRWITPVGIFIEKAYKTRDLEKYEHYRTRFEAMAAKVEDGIFDPRIPRDVFIAYSSQDMAKVNELLRVLEEENELTCFVAARNLRHGSGSVENYWEAIHTAISNCKAVVFVSSQSSRSIRCDALSELDYIKKNFPDMWRIEFLIKEYKNVATERICKEFFAGLEYCISTQQVAERYVEKMLSGGAFAGSKQTTATRQTTTTVTPQPKKVEEHKPASPPEPPASPLTDFEIENGVLKKYIGKAEKVVIPSSVTSIGEWAFNLCSSLTSISIPSSVTSIGESAFQGCSSLTSISIPNSVTSIGEYAFSRCSSLTSINIPSSVTSIGCCAFWYCISLTSINIPSSVTSIGEDAFEYCKNLKTIYCGARRQPAGWNLYWKGFCNAEVIWGRVR